MIMAKGKAGFTMPEVMVASLLMVMAIYVLYSTSTMYYGMIIGSRNYSAAEEMMFDKLWEIYNRPIFSEQEWPECMDSVNGYGDILMPTNLLVATPTNSVIPEGLIQITIIPAPAMPGALPNFWDMEAQVKWHSRVYGKVRSLTNSLALRRYYTERMSP